MTHTTWHRGCDTPCCQGSARDEMPAGAGLEAQLHGIGIPASLISHMKVDAVQSTFCFGRVSIAVANASGSTAV